MTVTAKINGQEARIMIDSGATGNFLAQSFARKHRLPWVKKIESVPLQNFDGTPVSTNGGRMDRETAALQLRVGLHQEEIRMDLTDIPGYDAILGKPWMKPCDRLAIRRDRRMEMLLPKTTPGCGCATDHAQGFRTIQEEGSGCSRLYLVPPAESATVGSPDNSRRIRSVL